MTLPMAFSDIPSEGVAAFCRSKTQFYFVLKIEKQHVYSCSIKVGGCGILPHNNVRQDAERSYCKAVK